MNRKDFKAEGSIVGGKFKAVISTDSVDRDGEVMVPAGMNGCACTSRNGLPKPIGFT